MNWRNSYGVEQQLDRYLVQYLLEICQFYNDKLRFKFEFWFGSTSGLRRAELVSQIG